MALTAGQKAYWAKKLPGASSKQIAAARSKQIADNNPQAFGPNTNLTPKQLGSQVQADTQLQYGERMQQVGTQFGQVDPIYDAYRNSINALNAQTKAQTDQATGDITSRAAALAAADHASNAQLFADLAKSAALTGGTVSPALQSDAQQAESSRQGSAGSDANLVTTLGANAQNFLTGQAALGEGARVSRKQTLTDQMNSLTGQAGAFKVQDRAKLIAAAQAAGINLGSLGVQQQNAQTAAGVAGVNAQLGQEKVQETGRHNVANEKTARTNARLKRRGQDINQALGQGRLDLQKQNSATRQQFHQDAQSMDTAKFEAKYGITPAQAKQGVNPTRGTPSTSNKITAGSKGTITSVNNAVGVIRQLTAAEGKKANTHKIRTVLGLPKSKDNPYGGYDHDIINAAYDIVTFGHLSPANRKALTALGVQIPKGW